MHNHSADPPFSVLSLSLGELRPVNLKNLPDSMNKVMVVEDSVTQREMICNLLKDSGLQVSVASDGVEALEQVQKNCPDLMVLDIVMPRMNGYELCRRLKSDPKTRKIAIVMCSSKGEEFDRYWGMKQGADAYIAKPFQPTELVGTVKQLLRG
ncbi:Response regulator receiver domain protein (CheY) (modular protein) [Planktothrix serta PCC 8927]|uniref:Response regulator receiver domain protein (CheY) (Modular protein) n=2 Tax=Planktothrix TaxID=54304 RepID=A0A7Z9BHQ3_9CYAN|nr:Response regulator receiver domain protein (CheY) (modular protein) [Planktothrix serta PCC 8927]